MSQNIKGRWIRPEDLYLYEEIGIEMFKISGRAMPTERILMAATAYSSRHYDGKLHDILNVLTPKIGFISAGPPGTRTHTPAHRAPGPTPRPHRLNSTSTTLRWRVS